jgi:hypothetical protein
MRDVLEDVIKEGVRNFILKNAPKGCDGQVQRVAQTFGLMAVAGELATSMGILPWDEGEATWGVETCFADWLAKRGGTGTGEMLMAVQQVRDNLARLGTKHFDLWVKGDGKDQDHVEAKSLDRWGFRTEMKGETHFLASPQGFQKLCAGNDSKATAKELIKQGILLPDRAGKSSALFEVHPDRSKRYYDLVLRETDEVPDGE